MYIALEGIKGTGKSSILKWLKCQLKNNTKVGFCSLTQEIAGHNPIEQMLATTPQLANDDSFVEELYYQRAICNYNVHGSKYDILISDRSILTSYVTRWTKWNNPKYTIKRVDKNTATVPLPDYVIYLNSTPTKCMKNISCRQEKTLGQRHEKSDSLIIQDKTFKEVFRKKHLLKKTDMNIVQVNLTENFDHNNKLVLNTIKNIINKTS